MQMLDPVATTALIAPIAVGAATIVIMAFRRLRAIHEAEIRRKKELKTWRH